MNPLPSTPLAPLPTTLVEFFLSLHNLCNFITTTIYVKYNVSIYIKQQKITKKLINRIITNDWKFEFESPSSPSML